MFFLFEYIFNPYLTNSNIMLEFELAVINAFT